MQFPAYNITLRLNGDIAAEVVKEGVTVPEIVVLRNLHGDEAVSRAAPAGVVDVDHQAALYGRLAEYYGDDVMERIFGKADYARLPTRLPSVLDALVARSLPGVDVKEIEDRIRAQVTAELMAQYNAPPPAPPEEYLPFMGSKGSLSSFDAEAIQPAADNVDGALDGPDRPAPLKSVAPGAAVR